MPPVRSCLRPLKTGSWLSGRRSCRTERRLERLIAAADGAARARGATGRRDRARRGREVAAQARGVGGAAEGVGSARERAARRGTADGAQAARDALVICGVNRDISGRIHTVLIHFIVQPEHV